jgi:RimJ/RimL family protein N-acetyltransferase
MNLLAARVWNACRTYRYDLPLIVLKKTLAPLVTAENMILFCRDLHQAGQAESDCLPHVAIRRVGSSADETFQALCRMYPHKHFPERIRESVCFIAVSGAGIAGFAWVGRCRLRIDEINYNYPLSADEIFIFDCFVCPQFRGQGIYPQMIRSVLACYRQQLTGIRVAYIAVSSVNRASIRGIRKAGFREFSRIRYWNWRGRESWRMGQNMGLTKSGYQNHV